MKKNAAALSAIEVAETAENGIALTNTTASRNLANRLSVSQFKAKKVRSMKEALQILIHKVEITANDVCIFLRMTADSGVYQCNFPMSFSNK